MRYLFKQPDLYLDKGRKMHLLCPELDEKLCTSFRKKRQSPLKLGTNNGTFSGQVDRKTESLKDISPNRIKHSIESLEYIDEAHSPQDSDDEEYEDSLVRF